MMKGVTLVPGTVVLLSLDGTLAYVEDVQPTHAGIVVLPEQPPTRKSDAPYPAGRVGMRKISPFCSFDREYAITELSDRNKQFIGDFEALRAKHGHNYIDRTPEELAADSAPMSKADRRAARQARREAKARLLQRCAQCNEQPGHPNHPGDHEFVAPVASETPEEPADETPKARRPRGPQAKVTGAAPTYTLLPNYSLDMARATKRGEKYADGNRFHRAVKALESLPDMTGTLDAITRALIADGGKAMANPSKVARRALHQLTKPDFGAVVTLTGADAIDEPETDEE